MPALPFFPAVFSRRSNPPRRLVSSVRSALATVCRLSRPFLVFFAATSLVSSAIAQSVHWQTSESGDPTELQLIFQDCAPEGDPQLPRIDGTTLTLAGSASQTTMNNFNFSRSTILTYRARSQRSGAIQIPAFTVQTPKGAITVPAFTGGATRTASDVNILSRLEPGSNSVWAGEVFPLNYVLDVARRSFNQLGTAIEWNPGALVVEEWSKFEPNETTIRGEQRLQISSNTRGYAKTPGAIVLNAANQLINIQSGSIGFGLFQTPRIEQLSVTSNRPSVAVRPLPTATITGFSGGVGQFKLTSKVVPTNAAVGEPVTWTLELSGTGNWPDIAGLPARDVSKDFNVVQPQARRTPTEGKLFDVVLSEDVVLVPTRAGTYTLGPVEFVYFDPASGNYKTASTPRTTVTITPAAAAANQSGTTSPTPATTVSSEPAPSVQPRAEMKSPAAPVGIPRDPLPGSTSSLVPMPMKQLVTFALLPFALVPLVWALLALQRARLTDPLRARREAYARIAAHLSALDSATDEQRSRLLLAWQHDAAILCGISQAAPVAVALPDAAWKALWAEADQALYSTARVLPPDWRTRAQTALNEKRVSSFSPFRLFLPKNLLPFVALAAFVMALAPHINGQTVPPVKESGEFPQAAYRSGNFVAAEKSWSDVLAKNPTDSIARYNLSLALAQQDRWAESVAHATASFVQNPSDSPARWQLALASEKAGFLPSPVSGFLNAGPRQSLAALTSPGRWQIYLVLSSAIVAGSLAMLLVGLYRQPSRSRRWSATGLLAAGIIFSVCAAVSLRTYGLGRDQRAVITWKTGILRSVPTEADTTQKTTALAAGSAAIEEKAFLGWVRVTFENGQTGWVRKEDVISLWK